MSKNKKEPYVVKVTEDQYDTVEIVRDMLHQERKRGAKKGVKTPTPNDSTVIGSMVESTAKIYLKKMGDEK